MSVIFLRNRNDENKMLKYSLDFGPIDEIKKSKSSEKPRNKACYVKHQDKYLGVIGTPSGPIFFINNSFYPFLDTTWSVRVDKKENYNIFTFIKNGIEKIRIEYTPPKIDELDPWSDEESEDFYIWVSAKRKDKEFIVMWTVK